MFTLTYISVILFLTFSVNVIVFVIAWQRKKSLMGLYFAMGMAGIVIWSLGAALDYAAVPLPLKITFAKIEAIGYLSALSLFTLTSISFAGNDRWLEQGWFKALVVLIPVVNILLVWTNDYHQWVWTSFEPAPDNTYIFFHGTAFLWMNITTYVLVVLMFANFWMAYRKGPRFVQKQSVLLAFALFIPMIANWIYHFGVGGIKGVDWSSVTFSISGVIFLYAFYGMRFLDIVHIARDTMIERMDDGVLALDYRNRIADFNRAAQAIFNVSRDDLWKPIQETAFAHLSDTLTSMDASLTQTSREIKMGEKFLEIRLTPLRDQGGNLYGRLIAMRDITARKQMEEALRKSEAQYRAIINSTPDLLFLISRQGVFLDFHCRDKSMLYIPPESFLNRNIASVFPAEIARDAMEAIERSLASDQLTVFEYALERNGKLRYFEDRIVPFGAEEVLSVVREITERKLAEDALRESEAHFREVFDNTAHGTFIVEVAENGDFFLGDSNKAEEVLTSIPRETVLGKRVDDAFPPELAKRLRANYSRAITGGKPISFEEDLDLPGVGLKSYYTSLAPVKDKTGRFYRIIGSTLEISERRRMEKDLEQRLSEIQRLNRELQESQAQVVEHQRALARLEERQQMARDLHDSVNQSIHSLMLFSETLVVLLQKKRTKDALLAAERIQESGKRALKELRLLLYKAQSAEINQNTDLIGALEDRLNMVERRVGVKAQVDYENNMINRIPVTWIENLYWIIMEALNNSLKHSQAHQVHIRFVCTADHFDMEIADDGGGFDIRQMRSGGYGMKSMNERARILGGNLSVISTPREGTSVRFTATMER